ncbi:MAG: hypothetical protein U9O82_11545 [Thermodesulfobacteriota bacterium]|nr:hypothetical protein [Thermodesulfobacteriota bacterium]
MAEVKTNPNKPPNFKQYFIVSIVWFGITLLIAKNFATNHFWIVVVSVYLFSLPIILCGIYVNTISQIRRSNLFAKRGWIFRFITSRPLKIILWVCWALASSFFILVQFYTYNYLDWFLFFLVIPVFWFVFKKFQKLISHELKPYLVYSMSLSWSRRLCPLIMLLIYVTFNFYFGEITAYPSIQDAINSKKVLVSDMTGSALVQEISQYLAFYEGVKDYAIGRLGSLDALLPMFLLGVGNLIVFYNACAIFTCFLIPAVEYRRMFGPLSDADQPAAVPISRVAAISAITVFLSFFIYLPSFSYIELYFQQTPELSQNRQNAESYTVQRLEKIDDAFFKEGTLVQLQNAKIEALHNTEVALAHLEGQTDRAFDRMEANVDHYLDWYYSLVGEYTRIANLLVGELENYMVKKLETSLKQGDAFKKMQVALDGVFSEYENAHKAYQKAAQEIMRENRVVDKEHSFQVVKKVSMEDVLNPPIHQDVVNLQHRLFIGGVGGAGTGVLTAVIVKKILGKVMGKNIIKLAAKALSKIVISKIAGTAGGAGAGAAAGAAAGSVVPGVGTAAGAVIGGTVGGIVVGVSVDKLLIELEEAISREDFRRDILSAIHEARIEFKAKLRF